ncbi:MAG: phage Gp37/Gp68 family protein [Syntrophorhabdaceae bacterium]|nr:phage Gp37/Gp68 family protein [Syntrophorhabdaceae bacterium]
MALGSNIEWTTSTWNPVTGCTKLSLGCMNCYAERMALRLQAMGQRNYVNGFKVTTHERSLELPLKWKKPQTIFVNSMSDLFHPDVPTEFIVKVFEVMQVANWHRYQILTKRSGRLLEICSSLPWSANIWMGVTVENQECLHRIDDLRNTPAKTKFLSLEPLLGPLPCLNLENIDWVIVGGESGPGARPMEKEWAVDICNQCKANKVPFFFKQWGGVHKKLAGRKLEGRTWSEMPSEAYAPAYG